MKKILINLFKLILILIMLAGCILGYGYIIQKNSAISKYSDKTIQFWNENKNAKFKVNQILLSSSANAVDNSEKKDMTDIAISQYTDIAIYIDNNSESEGLNEENTVNKLYIDNIKIETTQKNGNFIFGYKNPLSLGKYEVFKDMKNDKIEYTVIHSNVEKSNFDSKTPTYFTDCSDPITLGFINSNIIEHFKLTAQNKSVSYNGTILKTANVDLNKISPKISFDIHLVNNVNDEYTRKMYLDVPLENSDGSIESGYMIVLNKYNHGEYSFIKEASEQ